MLEIFKKINKKSQIELTETNQTTILINPENYIGGSATKSHRLVLFAKPQTDFLYIDFKPYNIEPNRLFIIPAGHTLYLPPISSDFYCWNLPSSVLSEIEKLWLFRFKYSYHKYIECSTEYLTFCPQNSILSTIFDPQTYLAENNISLQYIYQAENLSLFLLDTSICHRMTVEDLANAINISPKTLLRTCNNVFQEKPQHIIRYHLLVKAIVYIVCEKATALNIIAEELHFKDLGTFTRYIKGFTSYTPKEIRDLHLHLQL